MRADQWFFIIQCLYQNRDSFLITRVSQGNSYISKKTSSLYPFDRTTLESFTEHFLIHLNQVLQLNNVLLLPEIRIISFNRIGIPWTNNLAIITTINSVANGVSIFNGYNPFQLNCKIGNTPPRIQNIGSDNCICRADINTTSAGTTIIFSRLR